MKLRQRSTKFFARTGLSVLFALAAGTAFSSDGVIFTTDRTGTISLPGAVFPFSNAVYLDGGPRDTISPGLTDGTYYFQVTDPSGHTLLSTDPASCRQVTVLHGVITGASPASGACAHADGVTNPLTGQTPVQLAPFSAVSPGIDYEVWLIPKAAATVESDPTKLDFCPRLAKINKFKVSKVPVIPVGSCEPSSSLSVLLVTGSSVVSYVPKGSWSSGSTGVSVTNVEGTSVTPTLIPTPSEVNACASNPSTGVTVCTANTNEVYLFKGTSLVTTLLSAGTGNIFFSGGACTNCGVAMDATNNRAVITLSIAGQAGYQFLNLDTNTFASPIVSPAGLVSENIVIDPVRNLLLSASEEGNYEIGNIKNSTGPLFYEKTTGGGELDSSGMDCSTGIAIAPAEFAEPSSVFIADLTQAVFTPGSPSGTWTAPSQNQILSESILSAGACGSAIAQGTNRGVVSGEFGGDAFTAIALPTTSGSGIPAITDWVSCNIGSGWSHGLDPHTLTAYKSPSSGDPIAVFQNDGATRLAVVNVRKMLDPTIVPRTPGGHACATGSLPSSVLSFIPVP